MARISFGRVALYISIGVLVQSVDHDPTTRIEVDAAGMTGVSEATVGIDTVELEPLDSLAVDDEDHDYDDDDYDDKNYDNMSPTQEEVVEKCVDEHELCGFWADHGECEKNPGYMRNSCSKSCNTCPFKLASNSYGEDQDCQGEYKEELTRRVEKMDKYMVEEVSKPEYDKVRAECKNRHKLCVFWAFQGECDANPSFMLTNCAPACETCRMIDHDYRCPRDPNAKDALEPGDLNKMFTRITTEMDNVTIHSRPNDEVILEKLKKRKREWNAPWVITIDNFITDEQCDRLIELGGVMGYERSTDVGQMQFDGTFTKKESKTRTSNNAWCTSECYEDPLVQAALHKLEELTGISDRNSEYLQLLKYEKGQFYRAHHDYIEADEERNAGPRILTAFLYLNDVPAGGGTNFPDLDLTIMPKRGRILLWPSVLDEKPSKKDFSTSHQALDVKEGRKYGANGWIHLRDFKTPYESGCTG